METDNKKLDIPNWNEIGKNYIIPNSKEETHSLEEEIELFHNPLRSSFEEFIEKKIDEEDDGEGYFSEKEFPKSIFWEDLDKEIFEKQSWRINKLIPKEGFVVLASISGNKKSWIAMEMAKNIVSGEKFLNCDEFKTEGANVLYLNGENSKSEMQRRGRQLSFKSDSPHKLYIVNEDNLNLSKKEGYVWLKSFIEYYKINVVFIDTFIAVAGGLKEDKADEVRQFFNKFNSLKNSGVVLVWLMHLRKPNNFEGKAPKKEQLLGSQDKSASVEVLLMLHSEGDEINVYQRKNRLGKEEEPFKVFMKDTIDENGNTKTNFVYDGPIEESEKKKDQAKEIILGILEENEGKTTYEILSITNKEIGSKNTRTALSELSKDGIIRIEKKGKSNFYILNKNNEEIPETMDLLNKKD